MFGKCLPLHVQGGTCKYVERRAGESTQRPKYFQLAIRNADLHQMRSLQQPTAVVLFVLEKQRAPLAKADKCATDGQLNALKQFATIIQHIEQLTGARPSWAGFDPQICIKVGMHVACAKWWVVIEHVAYRNTLNIGSAETVGLNGEFDTGICPLICLRERVAVH